MTPVIRTIELVEHAPWTRSVEHLSVEEGTAIYSLCGDKVAVVFPSPVSNNMWALEPAGWVGIIPVTPNLILHISPKVTVSNLFGMLEVAYRLNGIDFGDSLHACGSMQEFFDHLASILAKRVLDRARIGLYRSYRKNEEHLAFVRGRIQLAESLKRPWNPAIPCRYDEHTGDIIENRILVWTLGRILRSGLCTEDTRRKARAAFRVVAGVANVEPVSARDCVGRNYSRLNADYGPLHALCRFFLESSGPTHAAGGSNILPFSVNMPALFELYVAQWLDEHLPPTLALTTQEEVYFDGAHGLNFRIDLVLKDAETRRPLAVLDTKYKNSGGPAPDDIQQVVAYAVAKGCDSAFLIYPRPIPINTCFIVGSVTVRSVYFEINGDLQQGGRKLLEMITDALIPSNVAIADETE